MSAHLYWRLNFSANNGNNPALAELAMHTSVGGANVVGGGTAGGTNINASFPATNAFDGNTATDCETSNTPSTISYQFASAQAIVEYAITASASLAAGYGPKSWTFEYSDDGTTWTVAAYVTNEQQWGLSEVRTFPVNRIAPVTVNEKGQQPAVQITPASASGYAVVKLDRPINGPGPHTVSGTVVVNGTYTAGILVRAYAKVTGELIGSTLTNGLGQFAINCGLNWTDVEVIAYDPVTYQALIFDQVTPA